MTSSAKSAGLVVMVAHGSPSGEWNQVASVFGEEVQTAFPDWECTLAFLGFGRPTFTDVLSSIEQNPPKRVLVAPVLLAPGGHLLNDISTCLADLRRALPDTEIERLPTLLEQPHVRNGIVGTIGEAIQQAASD